MTGLARRLVVCVSPNYLRLVDREHQTSGGDYHPQPSTRYHNCKIQMTTKTNAGNKTKTENIRPLEGITTLNPHSTNTNDVASVKSKIPLDVVSTQKQHPTPLKQNKTTNSFLGLL